jgi:(p)ppGpp synthase/HD superfamily hydrolase
MATIEKALRIAAKAHEGQKDKQGMPYILHPLRVMAGVTGEEAQIVAILHDVLEGTPTTFDDLRRADFSKRVLAAILSITHRRDESYANYIVGCKANEIARQVKLSDLTDNTRLDRVLFRPDKIDRDLALIRRYLLSYKFLADQITEEQYVALMEG